MPKKMRAHQIKSGKDVTRALRQEGIPIRNAKGSHRIATMHDESKFIYYDHGEYPKGTASFIIKALLAAGVIVPLLCYLLFVS